jgi:hypothetical protein
VIRRWLALRKKTASFQQLADEIQIPRSSLHKTLSEKDTYPDHNLGKFVEWYVRDRRLRFGSLKGADRVIQLLDSLDALLPQERADAAKELAAAYEAIFRKRKAAVPEWVEMLKTARPELLSGGAPGDVPAKKKGHPRKDR